MNTILQQIIDEKKQVLDCLMQKKDGLENTLKELKSCIQEITTELYSICPHSRETTENKKMYSRETCSYEEVIRDGGWNEIPYSGGTILSMHTINCETCKTCGMIL